MYNNKLKQDSFPVGCVPSAAVAATPVGLYPIPWLYATPLERIWH